jgi:hypothetical protein
MNSVKKDHSSHKTTDLSFHKGIDFYINNFTLTLKHISNGCKTALFFFN